MRLNEGPNVPVLALAGVGKTFGSTLALAGVDLAIANGEALGLVGHNGAGKSTLIRIVAGVHQADAGTMAIDGRTVGFSSPRDAYWAGIRVIHQDAPLVPGLDTVENAYLGRSYPRRFGLPDRTAMVRRVRAIAAEIAPDLDVETALVHLDQSQRQFVRLVRALLEDARLLVLDEPTAALSSEDAGRFYAVLARIRARGTAILLVTHKLDEIVAHCDRALVIADGRRVGTFAGDALTVPALVAAMGGGQAAAAVAGTPDPGPSVLSVRAITTPRLPRPVSLGAHAGEIVVLYGLVGSGRSELLDALWGRDRLTGGRILLAEKDFAPAGPRQALAAGIAYVPADRHRTGLFADESLVFNTTLPLLSRFRAVAGLPVPSARREAEAFRRAAEAVGLVHASPHQKAGTLSGGNQQKLIVSRWANRHSRVMLLDEPTEGVDILAKAAIRSIVRAIAADGNAVLVSTSDRDEALELGDAILVFRAGEIVARLARKEASASLLSASAQSAPLAPAA